jgi:hypothetical protein
VNVDIAEEETVSEGPMSIVDKTRNISESKDDSGMPEKLSTIKNESYKENCQSCYYLVVNYLVKHLIQYNVPSLDNHGMYLFCQAQLDL